MMFVKYIDKNGNWNELNEVQQSGRRSGFHQGESGIRYENHNSPKPVIEIKKPIVDIIEKIVEEDYEVYRDYLKLKKIKGYGLLKGDNIKIKALKEGYPD